MNECDIDKIVVEHANGFTMVDTRSSDIPCDFGSSYGGFYRPPHHSQFRNT